ncbi:hypothetical protein R5R35_012138 [Gryllus longicercus]|uniref:Kazal-like domain-containing protein n=1 Tax=Gryllus longicercus TaxID=2509291 RepID=A0AAN9V649_9ORTH
MSPRLALAVCLVAALLACGEAQQGRPDRQGTTTPTPPAPAPTAPLVDAAGAPVNCPCQSTQEYNPVCGSNGATYNNPTKLRCAQRCGYEVTLAYYGQCS